MKLDAPVPGRPCWVELGTPDLDAAKRFYTELFGWRPERDPRQEAGGYTVAHLGEEAVAALAPLYQESQPCAWNVSFAVSDADVSARLLTEAGGTVLVGPMDVFDLGRFVVALDPGGAAFQLWQAITFPGAGLFDEPGSLGWVELLTRDPARAESFYSTVFGWTVRSSEDYVHWGVGGVDFGGMVRMDEKYPPEVPPHWLPYFVVAELDASVPTALDAGAAALTEPTKAPDGPRFAVLRDPQGAVFGLYEPCEEDGENGKNGAGG
ncbi:VOC family protein [Streptomyces antibioticus]|uniref:VOC family protein n=1 Tax=Streptomyces antibioticus TaxID=1890 RepID=UPI002250DDEA|nr:VOC family protein [Streptomyces antibioticus]MCX5167261.1 VOC family protein [Streptomyces antibioticus]